MGMCIMAWQVSTVVEFTTIAVHVKLGTAFFFYLFLVYDELGHLSPMSADPSPPLSSCLVCWHCHTVSQGQGLEAGSVTFAAEPSRAQSSVSQGNSPVCYAPTGLRCQARRRDPFTVTLRMR